MGEEMREKFLPPIFEKHRERFVGQMRIPKTPMSVVIVDDNEDAVAGVRTLLENWANLETTVIIQESSQIPAICEDADILILDMDIKGMTADMARNWALDHEFTGTIASTATVNNNDEHACKHHFSNKVGARTSGDAAESFIRFMNILVGETELNRMI